MHNLAQEVGRRLDADKLKGRSLTLKILKRHPDAPTEAAKVGVTPNSAVNGC
jgi:DNA repair protein REV1